MADDKRVFQEYVDKQMVLFLWNQNYDFFKEYCKKEKDITKVKNFLRSHIDGIGETCVYKFADGKNFGRLYSSGVQSLP